MSARKRKAARIAAYRAGPLAPWRTTKSLSDFDRMLANRGRPRQVVMEIGRIESFRFISSPWIKNNQ